MSKYKEIILEALQEAKQVGNLYHATTLEQALHILATNKLKAVRDIGISTSRQLNNVYTRDSDIIFVLDGDKLSNKYKLEPFRYPDSINSYETIIQTNKKPQNIYDYHNMLIDLFNNDQEESEIVLKGSVLNNLDNYLIKILINKNNIKTNDSRIQRQLELLETLSPVPIDYMN